MIEDIKKDAKARMAKSLEALRTELSKIRTGRAHPSLLDHVHVDYYGNASPVNQVASVTIDDARTLVVTPWDKGMVKAVEKAIMTSDLGLNPVTVGQVIRIPLPPLTEERRRELSRVVHHEGENGKIAIRNIRRDANHHLKALRDEKKISEDDERRAESEIQKLTDQAIADADRLISEKEQELMAL